MSFQTQSARTQRCLHCSHQGNSDRISVGDEYIYIYLDQLTDFLKAHVLPIGRSKDPIKLERVPAHE